MVKEIVKDIEILSKKSERVIKGEDIGELIRDLIDTANEWKDRDKGCVGLAAVQLGVHKRVCVLLDGDKFIPIINPIIKKRSTGHHMSTEACLSVNGEQTVKRYDNVTIMYELGSFGKKVTRAFGKLHSVVIQHEIDHFNGRLI
jgi:peptide deformylase